MTRLTHKPLDQMSDDEALAYGSEQASMDALGIFVATNLLDHLNGREMLELRDTIERAVRECVDRAARVARLHEPF